MREQVGARNHQLRRGRAMPPGARGVIVAVVTALALAVSVSGAAAWSNYFGPGTMYASAGSDIAVSGWNNWTNNRVYRPLNYNFYLGYFTNGSGFHYSTDNAGDNPFYWPAYGYNYLICGWDWNGTYSSVNPVTCQGDV